VTLHFPHFGTPGEWYTVERMLRKHLAPWHSYVYCPGSRSPPLGGTTQRADGSMVIICMVDVYFS